MVEMENFTLYSLYNEVFLNILSEKISCKKECSSFSLLYVKMHPKMVNSYVICLYIAISGFFYSSLSFLYFLIFLVCLFHVNYWGRGIAI